MAILFVALHYSSLAGLVAAAVVSGVGQGISFSRGLAAVAEHTPADRRAEVSSTYFVVAYVAISLPVVGEGFAAQAWGLRTAGSVFALAVGVLAVGCLVGDPVAGVPKPVGTSFAATLSRSCGGTPGGSPPARAPAAA